jgi:eukaryotic-like serine/threonine-protein kinase
MDRMIHLTHLFPYLVLAVVTTASHAQGSPGEHAWPLFRGDPSLRGVADTSVPDKPQLLWTFKTTRPVRSSAVIGPPSVARAYIGSDDGHIYAIDLKTGRQVWKFQTQDAVESPPTLYLPPGGEGAVVLAGSDDGFVYCLDADTGSLKWKYETEDKIVGAAVVVASPADGRPLVLVGSHDARLHCVDLADGSRLWAFETDNYVNATAAVADGQAVFGGCDGYVHVVSVATGEKVKQIEIGNYIAASAAIVDGRVYVGHYGNEFICVDLAQEKVIWSYHERNFPYYSSPAVTEKLVLVGGRDKRLHAISRADGQGVWTFATRGQVDSSPVVAGDRVVVGSVDGRLYIVNLADGKELWSYEIGAAIVGSPAVAGGIIVIGAEDGNVYAFGEEK